MSGDPEDFEDTTPCTQTEMLVRMLIREYMITEKQSKELEHMQSLYEQVCVENEKEPRQMPRKIFGKPLSEKNDCRCENNECIDIEIFKQTINTLEREKVFLQNRNIFHAKENDIKDRQLVEKDKEIEVLKEAYSILSEKYKTLCIR